MSLNRSLESGNFAVSCEFGPRKGTDTHEIKENIEILKGKSGCRQRHRPAELGHAAVRPGYGFALRAGRAGAHLPDDLPRPQPHRFTVRPARRLGYGHQECPGADRRPPRPWATTHRPSRVFDLDSVTLLQTITDINGGKDLSGNELKGAPAFFPGAVVKVENNTEASFELQIAKMQKENRRRGQVLPDAGLLRCRNPLKN